MDEPDPFEEGGNRNKLDALLQRLPGFRGYLDVASRRASDLAVRQAMADRLNKGKQGIDQYMRSLIDKGNISGLSQCESLRRDLDRVIARLRAGIAGYSSFFQTDQIDAEILDEVYHYDLWTFDEAEKLARKLDSMGSATEEPLHVIPPLREQLRIIDQRINDRLLLLQGKEPEGD